MTRRNVRKQGWVFPLFSPDSDDRLSLNFHRFVILYISCDTRSVGLGQYCLPKVSNGFNCTASFTVCGTVLYVHLYIHRAREQALQKHFTSCRLHVLPWKHLLLNWFSIKKYLQLLVSNQHCLSLKTISCKTFATWKKKSSGLRPLLLPGRLCPMCVFCLCLLFTITAGTIIILFMRTKACPCTCM